MRLSTSRFRNGGKSANPCEWPHKCSPRHNYFCAGAPLHTIPKIAGALVLLALALSALSQDTRQVTEPLIPPTCITLKATLSAPTGALSEADESRLDTQRIQDAIDNCAPGRAV